MFDLMQYALVFYDLQLILARMRLKGVECTYRLFHMT